MVRVQVLMKLTRQPFKRTPLVLYLDTRPDEPIRGRTDRNGVAVFDVAPASGRVVVDGEVRYQGRLEGDIEVSLWSPADAGSAAAPGAPGAAGGGTAYPGTKTLALRVNSHSVITDSEGYLIDPGDWSEAFVRAEAAREGLELTDEHWEVIRFLRGHYERYQVQANVRDVIRHVRQLWGPDLGSDRHLRDIFPGGGPQQQGKRLAGLLRVKGEH